MKSARLVLIVLLSASALASCAKRDTTPPANSGEPTTTTTEATNTTADPEAAIGTVVTLDAKEYAYDVTSGATKVPAGRVTVEVSNTGKEEHQATIIKLKDGKTIDDLATLGSDPSKLAETIDVYGGPNAVAPDHAITTGSDLEAGDYFFACFIPAADGAPHAAKGMIIPFTVEGTAATAAPVADNTIELKDYAFGVEDGALDAGSYTFHNRGPQPHEAAIYAPVDGKTTEDVIDYFNNPTPPAGPPPFESAGGVAPISVGESSSTELVPGDYVFVCFILDSADGAPHFVHGMLQTVTVT